jgi:peptide/nickel transport system permease protein
VLLIILGVALYALTQPISYYDMTEICGTNQTNPNTYNSFSNQITVGPPLAAAGGLPNGSYSFVVTPVKGYVESPSSGTFVVQGAAVSITITFTAASGPAVPQLTVSPGAASAPAATAADYSVTFLGNNVPFSKLPLGTGWSVTVNNTSPTSCVAGYPSLCTYPAGSTAPGPGCYQTPALNPSVVPPTINFQTGSVGPLPLGGLTLAPDVNYFYDTYPALLRGADWSLLISATIVGGGAFLGLLLGAVSGYYGGAVDETLMRLVDIFLSIPQILFVIIVVAAVTLTTHSIAGLGVPDTKILLLIIAFMVTWWPFYARLVRGQVLVTREQKYVEAARASGARGGRIVTRHIIPNSVFPVFVQMSLDVGTIPLFLGTLVFLGFLIFPYQQFPEWGAIAANSVIALQLFLTSCQLPSGCVIPWWQIFFPGFALFMYAISVNFFSDGIRDALDPRLRR